MTTAMNRLYQCLSIMLVVLGLALTTPNALIAQKVTLQQPTERWIRDSTSDFAGSIQRSKSKDPTILLLGYTAVTFALFATDQETYNFFDTWKANNRIVRDVSSSITELGNGVTSFVLFGGMYGYSKIVQDEQTNHTAILGLEAFALSGVTVQLLKHVFSRERPNVATVDRGKFRGLFAHFREPQGSNMGIASFDAFPSGHTATIFAAATVLSDSYQSSVLTIGAYSIAGAVGISRITEQTHWASDVFVGALIGYYSAKLVERWNESGNTSLPHISISTNSIRLSINF